MSDRILERLRAAWSRSDEIFDLVGSDALHERPISLRHPFVFYLGHLPAFGWNQVVRGLLGREGFQPLFDDLFERGIDPLEESASGAAGEQAWPPVTEILAYRDRVRDELCAALPAVRARSSQDVMAAGDRVYHVVLEHELMHHETLLYMLQQRGGALRGADAARPAWAAVAASRAGPEADTSAARPGAVAIPAGTASLGADFDAQPFGWDNEFPTQQVPVPGFSIDALPVTNARYAAFVADGGYADARLWPDGADEARRRLGLEQPHFWSRRDGQTFVRTLQGDVPWDQSASWPVSVSWIEARAFALWEGRRLPTEAEYHRAAYGTPEGTTRRWPWGDEPPAAQHGNFGMRRGAPVPVGSHPAGASAFGVHELVGNGWEWTSTRFGPLPGFDAYMPHYPGYSADFFDERHYVMLGASWATDAGLVRRSLRNWFQDRYPYVFTKFRCVD